MGILLFLENSPSATSERPLHTWILLHPLYNCSAIDFLFWFVPIPCDNLKFVEHINNWRSERRQRERANREMHWKARVGHIFLKRQGDAWEVYIRRYGRCSENLQSLPLSSVVYTNMYREALRVCKAFSRFYFRQSSSIKTVWTSIYECLLMRVPYTRTLHLLPENGVGLIKIKQF